MMNIKKAIKTLRGWFRPRSLDGGLFKSRSLIWEQLPGKTLLIHEKETGVFGIVAECINNQWYRDEFITNCGSYTLSEKTLNGSKFRTASREEIEMILFSCGDTNTINYAVDTIMEAIK